jgi:hypothetical protein
VNVNKSKSEEVTVNNATSGKTLFPFLPEPLLFVESLTACFFKNVGEKSVKWNSVKNVARVLCQKKSVPETKLC